MFQSISWFQYALFVGVAFCLYYLGLSVWTVKKRLSKNRLQQRAPAGSVAKRIWSPKEASMPDETSQKDIPAAPASSFPSAVDERRSDAEEADINLMPQVHDLLDEVQALMEEMKEDPKKDVLLQSLHKIVHKYPAVIDSSFRPNIATMIMVHSENECALRLSDEDVNRLWK